MSPPPALPGDQRLHKSGGINAAVRTRKTRRRRPRKLRHDAANNASKASSDEINGATCQSQDDISQDDQKIAQEFVLDQLPDDILRHIHSLLRLRDAARVACVSRGLLRSWKCYSNLKFSHRTFGLSFEKSEKNATHIITKIDHIITNHDANGVKVQTLDLYLPFCSRSDIDTSYLNRWLQITGKHGIKELRVVLARSVQLYSFPCSVLCDESAASSIQRLELKECNFRPTATLGRLARLTSVSLYYVGITDEELGHFLSKSVVLEKLYMYSCSGIACLRIPCTLQRLKFLSFTSREMIQLVEINAPNLSSLSYDGTLVDIYVRDSSQLKNVKLSSYIQPGIISYARARLPSVMQRVESLTLTSINNIGDKTPMLPHSRFMHLKELDIDLNSNCDLISMVSFLDASPVLDSFTLHAAVPDLYPADIDSVLGEEDDGAVVYHPSRVPGYHRHDRLRRAKIMMFSSAKSLVDLTIHILDSAPSLEHLKLDTICKHTWWDGKCVRERGWCKLWDRELTKARRAVKAVNRCIVGRVPSSVEFEVVEPCINCNPSYA